MLQFRLSCMTLWRAEYRKVCLWAGRIFCVQINFGDSTFAPLSIRMSRPTDAREGAGQCQSTEGEKKSMDNCGWCRNKEFLDAKQQQGNCKIIRNCYGRAWEDHCRSRASFQSFKLRAPCKPWTLFSFVQRHIDFWKYPPVEAVVNEVVDALVHLTRLLQRLVVGVRIQLRGATKKKIESFQKWIVRRGPLMLTCCWKKNLLLIIDLATRKEWAT